MLGLLTWWLDNGQPLPPERMGRLFQQLATRGAAHVLGLSPRV